MNLETPKWDAVIFDVDGTLIDSVPFIVETFQHAFLKTLGRIEDEDLIKSGIGMPLETVFNHQYPEQSSELMAAYLDYNLKNLRNGIGVFLGVPQMLAALKARRIPLAIVTSKRMIALRPSLEDFDLHGYFDLIITKEDTKLHKPNPEPLFAAMERLNLSKPGRVLYVGDSIHDLECAVRAGCQPVMVEWTRMPKHPLKQAHPAVWINRPDELISFLEN